MTTASEEFLAYFPIQEEYPKYVASELLPVNTLWEYVSNSFLNGIINYVAPVKAYVLGRYLRWDEDPDTEIQIQEPPGSFKWKKIKPKTKDELFTALVVPGAVCHSNLDTAFQDDVLILAKAPQADPKAQTLWVFFWFDRDCSDCCIGRFTTEDYDEVVIHKFTRYVQSRDKEDNPAREIPLTYFSGWLAS